jgi:hypothetical protein
MQMPLDLGGGDFNDIRWMAQDRTWRADGEDINLKQAVFDLENIKTGWVSFQQGTAPEVEWDNGAKGPRPHTDAEWKRGFEVEVYAPKTFGDEAPRTFMTSATGACMGLQALYVEYEEQREANEGKVPLCKFSGGEAIKVGKGSTSVPQLTISKWIERPEALKNSAAPAPAEAAVEEEDDDDAEF